MSAKLLYSMSDENQELKKQIGCMNGLLQFFDPHHFINNRVNCSTPSPGENKQQERAVKNGNKRSKDRNINVKKEMQVNPIESSRLSVSSSASTAMSSSEYDWNSIPEQSPFSETVGKERHSCDYQANQLHSSLQQPNSPTKMSPNINKSTIRETVPTCESPVKSVSREEVRYDLKHIDSPRLSQTPRPDSPRLTALNESFRSISSNHSAPVITPRNKDSTRLSYDSRETKDNHISSLKLKDLPRLSLDSKQRTIKISPCESKDDLLLRGIKRETHGSNKIQTEPQEPASYRAPSNIVAKLMGLQALPDDTPSKKSLIEHDGSSIFRSSDLLSRSTRTIDESKLDRLLHSPKSNCKESRALRSNKAKSEQIASIHQEVHSEPNNNPLTIYGAIEKRLADLDFQKSGKDLRALKQILESMHREKSKLETRREYQSSYCASQTSNSSTSHISPKQGTQKTTTVTSTAFRSVKDIESTKGIKPTAIVKGSRKDTAQVVSDIPLTSLQRLRIVQPANSTKDSEQKKSAKDLKETHHIRSKYSGERTPRPVRTSKAPEHMSKTNGTNSVRISDTRSSPATSGSRVKQSQLVMGSLSQTQKLQQNSSLSQESDDQSSELSNESTCQSQQGNTIALLSPSNKSIVPQIHRVMEYAGESCMKYKTPQQGSGSKTSRGIRGDMALEEQAITVKEQPSPVSVLDANFFEDETPSPIRKKPTAFRDFETNATYAEAEWIDNDPTSPDSMRPGFCYDSDYHKLEIFKESAPAVWNVNPYQHGNLNHASPLYKKMNMEKSYVSELLLASGFSDYLNYTMADHPVLQSQEAINPKLFFVLEQTTGSSFNSKADRMTRTKERHRRKLLFDAVNEILSQKLSQPRSLLKKQSEHTTCSPQFLQEIFKEIDQLQPINLPQSLDDEEDFLTTIIGKDLAHRSANWTDVSGEIPALVLDIERLIFKDLIVELVQDEEVQAQKHRKQ